MNTYYFETAGLCFSVSSEIKFDFGAAGKFFYSDKKSADIHFEIKPGTCYDKGKLIYNGNIFSVTENAGTVMRHFRNRLGDFVLTRNINDPFSAVLTGNKEVLKEQEEKLINGYFALEAPLIHKNIFILHSSLVKTNGFSIAFSGVSGAGKTTQSELWKKYKNADIISGDRSCVRVCGENISAHGTFYSGSSDIYRNDGAPLKAIVFLSHSDENKLERLSPVQAFRSIYAQALNNSWDKDYVEKLIALTEKVSMNIPVYSLSCRPDEESVNLLYNELFR